MAERVLFLNLPYSPPVVRKYQCTYYAQGFLMPPVELAYLASSVKGWGAGEAALFDAVAEGWSVRETLERVRSAAPDVLVALVGFGVFPHDMRVLAKLKEALPDAFLLCFGYLPTLFPEDVLKHCPVDGVLMGEPEMTLREVLARRREGRPLDGTPGLAIRGGDGAPRRGPDRGRIMDLDALPPLDLSLLKLNRYVEPLLGRGVAPVLAIRGCPFPCAYCVPTYGARVAARSTTSLLDELQGMKEEHDIRSLRFFGDTFTIDRAWTLALCEGMRERRLNFRWTCRTRLDRVDDEVLAAMKAAGCVRIYAGVESGSQKVLDFYRKQYTVEEVKRRVALIRKHGIEAHGFFIVGAPVETKEDVEASIRLAKETRLDYVLVTRLQYWPGAPLFEQWKDEIEFTLFPFRNQPTGRANKAESFEWERRFYREFYLRPEYVLRQLARHWRNPIGLVRSFARLLIYLGRSRRQAVDDFI